MDHASFNFFHFYYLTVGRRNVRGDDRLYVRKSHAAFDFLEGLYENQYDSDTEVEAESSLFQGMSGKILVSRDTVAYKGFVYFNIICLLL